VSDLADLYRKPAATPAAAPRPVGVAEQRQAREASMSLAARLGREIREGRVELPVLPRAAIEVQELIAREADVSSIVRAIEREPIVAAALIKYANAAVYAGLREVTDLQQAISRLGFKSVRETVVSLSARAAFKADNAAQAKYYQTIWKHSLTTAVAARRLAAFVSVPKETAFLAGLLHDIGRICVLRGIMALKKRDPKGFVVPENTMTEFMDALHCPIGEVLCQAWNIPADLRDAIARHHDTNLTEPKDALAAVVQVADLMAAKIGASLHPQPDLKLVERPAFTALQLDDVKVAMLLVELEDECESMSSVMG
jgi:putative nucleotidyltransferase with HDIG domain